jgi:cytochrome b6-f complex iron-sulfur subunit
MSGDRMKSVSPSDLPVLPGGLPDTVEVPTRRHFLARVGAGWTIFAGAALACLGAAFRFLFPNDRFDGGTRFSIGHPEDFAPGAVDGRWKGDRGIYVVRQDDRLYVLSARCTHLRCAVDWQAKEGKFKCPCHGSGFSLDGINLEGPAPRPLERFKVTLAADGRIEVDKSRKYQEELGQWKDPGSSIVVRPRPSGSPPAGSRTPGRAD